jgi:hypothetical protein
MTEPIPFHVEGDPIDPDPRRLAAALRSVPEPPEPVEVLDTDGVVLGAFGSWRASWMNPGQVAQLRRMEALERMEQAERAAERQERADNRWQLGTRRSRRATCTTRSSIETSRTSPSTTATPLTASRVSCPPDLRANRNAIWNERCPGVTDDTRVTRDRVKVSDVV